MYIVKMFSPSLSPAILVYRVFRNEAKRNVKLLHGIIHLLALIISIIGEIHNQIISLFPTPENNSLCHCVTSCVFVCVCVGFAAVFDFHRAAKIPDMYSLHSWCGMATLVLFCVQVYTHTDTHRHRHRHTQTHTHTHTHTDELNS